MVEGGNDSISNDRWRKPQESSSDGQTPPVRSVIDQVPRPTPEVIACKNGSHFIVKGCLGRGGLGIVYLCQRQDHQLLAVKLSKFVGDAFAELTLSQEAEMLSNLNHPNIASVVDRGETIDGEQYLAMEYVEAPTLEQVLEREISLSLKRTARICSQIADAIEHVHDVGYIHNDLKPSNVLVLTEGDVDHVYVLDFGIARKGKEFKSEEGSTVMATMSYIAPERFVSDIITQQSDVYQLGLIMYECLTGHLPFDVDTESMMSHRRFGDLVPAVSTQGASLLPKPAKVLLQRALSRDPSTRPANMQLLLAELVSMSGELQDMV